MLAQPDSELLRAWQTVLRRDPGAVLVTGPQEAATARQMDAASLQVAGEVTAQGVRPGDVVLLQRRDDIAWLTTFLGLVRVGAVVVPVEPEVPHEAARQLAANLRVRGILSEEGWSPVDVLRPRRFRDPTILLGKRTSGSTGTPKVFWFRTSEMIADARQVMSSMGLTARDTNLAAIPLGHSYGLGNLVLPFWLTGMRIHLSGGVFPHLLATAARDSRATIMPGTPALFHSLLRSEVSPRDFDSVRTFISAGAPLTPDLAHRFRDSFGRPLHTFYGSSETGGIAYDRTGEAASEPGNVGTAMDGVTLSIVRGRVRVRSPAVHRYGRKAPSFLLADSGTLRSDGSLILGGRKDLTVRVGGRRVDLGEIENQARQIDGLIDACVVHRTRGHRDVLALVFSGEASVQSVREALAARLPPWQRPRLLHPVHELPRTARGKIDRAAIAGMINEE